MARDSKKVKSTLKKRIPNHNARRSYTITMLKRKNLDLNKEMKAFILETELQQDQITRIKKMSTNLVACSALSIYRENCESGEIALIHSNRCSSKLCFICNYSRQKTVRRKYMRWFKENRYIVELADKVTGKRSYTTQARIAAGKQGKNEVIGNLQYDLMHLTLTVPHTAENGYNGDHYYFTTIAEKYHRMRKELTEWNYFVLGGEYGIEIEKKSSGNHIHIHSLLLVRQVMQSRNTLHRAILMYWNRVTVNKYSERTAFNQIQIDGIRKGNKKLTYDDVVSLHPGGATLIGLETIFSFDAKGQKVRATEWGSKEMMIAVMETISYHFEPHAFDKETGKFDLPMLADISTKIHNVKLYAKFGALYGEKSLNVSDDTKVEEEYAEAVEEMVDQNTGEISLRDKFYLINPAYVHHLPEKEYQITFGKDALRKGEVLKVETTGQAIALLGERLKMHHRCKN